MGKNQDYKNRALNNLEGNWGSAAILTLVYVLVVSVVSKILSTGCQWSLPDPAGMYLGMTFNIGWIIFCLPIGWAFFVSFLDFIRGDKLRISKLWVGFKDGNWLRIMGTMLLVEIYTFLWTLLLIIPGIIKSLSYSQTAFILRDNPELKYNEAIEKSMRMMEGHKTELFWLYLSFIGWAILSLMTLCIGFLLLLPYFYSTLVHFYEDLKAEQAQ